MAGYSASVKLNNLVITSLDDAGQRHFQLHGAEPRRTEAGPHPQRLPGAGLYLVWALCVPLTVLYFFAGAPLVKIFVDNPTQKALATGVQFLHIVAPFYVIVASKIVADGVPARRGQDGPRSWSATFTDLLLRVALAFVLLPHRSEDDRHLAVVADRLDRCNGLVSAVLPLRATEAGDPG